MANDAGSNGLVSPRSDQDLAGSRLAFKALCDIDGIANNRVVRTQAIAQAASYRFTRIDADADTDCTVTAAALRVDGRDRALDVLGATHRTNFLIVLINRSAEDDHDGIANELVD